MDEIAIEEGDTSKDVEVAPALISIHPAQNFVAVAVGSDLRVFDLVESCPVSLDDESVEKHHKDSIRAICYGSNGKLFISAGDDKIVKIWCTDSWRCIYNVFSEKRVSAAAISPDGLHVCFADKFGVIWVVNLDDGIEGKKPLTNKKALPLLSHYCSIITSLALELSCILFLDKEPSSIHKVIFHSNLVDKQFFLLKNLKSETPKRKGEKSFLARFVAYEALPHYR